ncbi:MAG: hypothetical protein GX177_01600 [Firmicutes bacterium]|nr:hypothetical protein [Bacillota bacterium]
MQKEIKDQQQAEGMSGGMGMLNLNKLNADLEAVLSCLEGEHKDPAELWKAKSILEANLAEFGRYARSNQLSDQMFACNYLESYSLHCYYYAVVLDCLDERELIEEIVYTAAQIYPRYDEDYYDSCQSLWQRALIQKGLLPTLIIKEFLKQKQPNLNRCLQQLYANLKYLP